MFQRSCNTRISEPRVTSAAEKRLASEAAYAECVRANAVAQGQTGLPRNQSSYTPSGIAPCTWCHDTIINNQYKAQVQAAQGCPQPKVGVRNAPVFVTPKEG